MHFETGPAVMIVCNKFYCISIQSIENILYNPVPGYKACIHCIPHFLNCIPGERVYGYPGVVFIRVKLGNCNFFADKSKKIHGVVMGIKNWLMYFRCCTAQKGN